MTSTVESIPVVNGYLAPNTRIALAPCPQCGFHHEHKVTVPGDCWIDREPIDAGVHTSKCTESSPIQYRIVLTDYLTANARVYIAKLNSSMARGAMRREQQLYRERHQRWERDERDRARAARAAKHRAASYAVLGLSPPEKD